MQRRLIAILMVLLLAGSAPAGTIWVEAESFANPGGWTSDTQFIPQVGSPYLMAIGLGKPVADAVTTITPPRPARYRVWARTRDWVPDHHPGQFQILVGGKTLGRAFGASGKSGWIWEDGGVCELSGPAELRMKDLTGYYGRCDAIVLCDDLQWVPPAEKDAIARLREAHGGVSKDIKEMGRYDVVIVGGGLAGCTAAVASARSGARTILIQDRSVLGGTASTEILVPPVGIWPHSGVHPLDPRETGLVEEYRTIGNQRVTEGKLYSGRLARFVSNEPNLEVLLNTHVTGVTMRSPRQIESVVAMNVRTGQRMRFAGTVFVDCTGDGIVGVAAGAEHRMGRESRAMHNEPMAPEVADERTMGNSLKYVSQPADAPQSFKSPAWAMQFPTCDHFNPGRHPRLGGDIGWQWMLELGGTRNTFTEAEEIRDDVLRLIYGLWDHVKNTCPKLGKEAENHRLVWVGHVAGRRETRRLIGDCILTENDISRQTVFPDAVAYGAWGIDDHFPEGFLHKGQAARHEYKSVEFSIPYRTLYSRNIDNLLMAGRNHSATHIAMAATRVMLTCAIMGHAAGSAAGMCIARGTTPRGIYQDYLGDLQQQLLKDGAYIIGLPNRDPHDKALKATVAASSERVEKTGERMAALNVIDGFARYHSGKTSAWAPDAAQAGPHWIELRWNAPQTFNAVHVSFLTHEHAAARFAIEAAQGGTWKPLAEISGNTRRRLVIPCERVTTDKMRLALPEVKPTNLGVCEIRVYDEPAHVLETSRRAARNTAEPDARPELPWDERLDGAAGLVPAKLPGIVLDDNEAQRSGGWIHSTYGNHFVLDGFLHDGNSHKGEKTLVFRPVVRATGRYDIRLAYNAQSNRASNTPVTIATHAGEKTVKVNQRQKPGVDGLFHSLGVFDLAAGENVLITVSNAGTSGYVVADAVQLVAVEK